MRRRFWWQRRTGGRGCALGLARGALAAMVIWSVVKPLGALSAWEMFVVGCITLLATMPGRVCELERDTAPPGTAP